MHRLRLNQQQQQTYNRTDYNGTYVNIGNVVAYHCDKQTLNILTKMLIWLYIRSYLRLCL